MGRGRNRPTIDPENLIEPIIIVAVANTGEDRIHEYAPTGGAIFESALEEKRSRGLGREYGRFLIEELKPFIDRKYRTKPEAEFTGLGGSSMGGLITLALGLWFPEFFRRLMVMSPAVWWDDEAILRMIDELDGKLPLKIWLDTGTDETGWERPQKCAIGWSRKAGGFPMTWNIAKRKAPTTTKRPGERGSRTRCGSCFRRCAGEAAVEPRPLLSERVKIRQAPFFFLGSAKLPSLRNFA